MTSFATPLNSAPDHQASQTLPRARAVLLTGLFSILLAPFGGAPGFLLAVTSLLLGRKAKQTYDTAPGEYQFQGFQNLYAGRICAIIGLVISLLVMYLFAGVVFGGEAGPGDF